MVYLYVDDRALAESEDADDREAIFEDAYFVEVDHDGDEPVRLSRAFSVPGGNYDVYVAVRDSLGEDADDDDRDARPLMVFKAPVAVPDLWTADLQTSTVFVGQIEQLSAPLSPQEQIEQPYTFGPLRITPKHDNSFGRQEELSLLMMVYNPRLDNDMPNVTVEFNFHTVTRTGRSSSTRRPRRSSTPRRCLRGSAWRPATRWSRGSRFRSGCFRPATTAWRSSSPTTRPSPA